MTISNISDKAILATSLIIVLVILANSLPPLLQTLAKVICILVATTVLFIIKKVINGKPNNNKFKIAGINLKDVFVILLSFIGLPLITIFLATSFRITSNNITTQNSASISACLEFINTASEISKELLELFL